MKTLCSHKQLNDQLLKSHFKRSPRLKSGLPFSHSFHPTITPILQRKPNCACGGGCPHCLEKELEQVQPKLKINSPNDQYEQDADRMADQVVQQLDLSAGVVSKKENGSAKYKPPSFITPISHPIQKSDTNLSAQPYESSNPNSPSFLISRLQSTQGSGYTLPNPVRSQMEESFGTDFGNVRIHDSEKAAKMNEAIQAKAFTYGRDIYFGQGQYRPNSRKGQRLLAHELTHTVQQGNASDIKRSNGFIQRFPRNTPHGKSYTPGVNHNHRPSGRWKDIQAIEWKERSVHFVKRACGMLSPVMVMTAALHTYLLNKNLAKAHFLHYFHGRGKDYEENVMHFIRGDSKVRRKLANYAIQKPSGHFKVTQYDYQNQDFRFAFGAIDRLDYEVDTKKRVVHVWFADRYEFHPVYDGIYKRHPGDGPRKTNCVHAAAVEMKAKNARDFWMFGYGAIPLSVLVSN